MTHPAKKRVWSDFGTWVHSIKSRLFCQAETCGKTLPGCLQKYMYLKAANSSRPFFVQVYNFLYLISLSSLDSSADSTAPCENACLLTADVLAENAIPETQGFRDTPSLFLGVGASADLRTALPAPAQNCVAGAGPCPPGTEVPGGMSTYMDLLVRIDQGVVLERVMLPVPPPVPVIVTITVRPLRAAPVSATVTVVAAAVIDAELVNFT